MDRSTLVPCRSHLVFAAAALLAFATAGPAAADSVARVVTSIKPVHSLVSAVMAGAGEPHLIMRGVSSPHDFNLRPSDAAAIEDALVIFLIDESLEASLAGPAKTLAGSSRVVELCRAKDLIRRPLREGGAFEADDHERSGEGPAARHDDHERDDHRGSRGPARSSPVSRVRTAGISLLLFCTASCPRTIPERCSAAATSRCLAPGLYRAAPRMYFPSDGVGARGLLCGPGARRAVEHVGVQALDERGRGRGGEALQARAVERPQGARTVRSICISGSTR